MKKIFLYIILAIFSLSGFAKQNFGIKTKADALSYMRYFVSYTRNSLPLSLYGERLWYKTTLETNARNNYYYIDGEELGQTIKEFYNNNVVFTTKDLYKIIELTLKNIDVVQEMEVYQKIPDLRQAQKILNLPTTCFYIDKKTKRNLFSFTFTPSDVFFIEKAYQKVGKKDFIEDLYPKIYGIRIGSKYALKSLPRKISDKIILVSGGMDKERIHYVFSVEDGYLKDVSLQVLKAIAFKQIEDFLGQGKKLNLCEHDISNTLKILDIYGYKLDFTFKGRSSCNNDKHFQISINDISAYLNK